MKEPQEKIELARLAKERRDKAIRARRTSQIQKYARSLFGSGPLGSLDKEQRGMFSVILSLSEKPEIKVLAEQLVDPSFASLTLPTLMENAGITFHTLADEVRSVRRSEGFLRASSHLPEIMEQVAEDSKSQQVRCTKCGGTGKEPDSATWQRDQARAIKMGIDPKTIECPDRPCLECDGKGRVTRLGDPTRLKLMLEMFQLIGQGTGPVVNLDLRKIDQVESLAGLAGSVSGILEGEIVKEDGS